MIKGSCSKQIIITFIIALITLGLYSIKVSAQIINSTGTPIEDVTITDGYKRIFSNRQGHFDINTKSDSLIISKLGYERRTLATKNIPHVITLNDKQVVLSPVKVIERYEPGSMALDKTILSPDSDSKTSSPTELLLKESSIQSSSTRLIGESQTLSLLGNLSRHTLVMLDNVPLNPHGEVFDLASLPLDTIKRIEIVKGNASLYGGASAIGGIIYLYTNDENVPVPLSLEHETSYGSFNQFRQNYSYEQKSAILNYRIAVSRQSADNDFHYKPRAWWPDQSIQTRNNNSKKQEDVSCKISSYLYKVNWIYNLDAEQFYRELPGPVNYLDIYKDAFLTGQNTRQNLTVSYKANKLDNFLILWDNRENTSYNNTQAPNPVYLSKYSQNHSSLGLKNQTVYSFEPVDVSLELESSRQSYERKDLLEPTKSIPSTSRNQNAISLMANRENQWQYFTNNLQAGIRMDDVTDFGSYTSWRVEELLKTDTAIQLLAGATLGSSYSLPSFFDLYWKGDSQSLGNPELKPETSMGGSIRTGISWRDYSMQAAYYKSEVKDLIQWRQIYLFGTHWMPDNMGKATISNWELEAKAKPFTWFNLNNSLTLTDAKSKNGNYLAYTADTKWVSEAIFSYRDYIFNLNLDYTGKQWTTADQLNEEYIAPVILFNSGMQYNYFYKKLTANIYVQLNNLFDKQYEVYAYVPQPGFNWMCGIKIKYDM